MTNMMVIMARHAILLDNMNELHGTEQGGYNEAIKNNDHMSYPEISRKMRNLF